MNKPRTPHLTFVSVVWQAALVIALGLANYYLLYVRHGVSAGDIPHDAEIHMQAEALAYITVSMTAAVAVIMDIDEQKLHTRYRLGNYRMWAVAIVFMACVTSVVYTPSVAEALNFAPIHASDWLYTVLAAAVFVLVREFQRWDRKHHKKAIHALHREIHGHSPEIKS